MEVQPERLVFDANGVPYSARYGDVYASREGVFITCAGCSLLGKQASLLALEGIGVGAEERKQVDVARRRAALRPVGERSRRALLRGDRDRRAW